jgi:tight adherence protein C
LQLRQDLYLAAENHAMKAPLRLLVPLVLLIFPSTFIVLLFPVLFRVQQEFAR